MLEQETLPQKSENYLNIIRERTDAMRTLTIARLLTEKMTGNIKAEYAGGELVIQVDF